MKPKAKPAKEKIQKKTQQKRAAKPVAQAAKPAAKAKKPVAKKAKPAVKTKSVAKAKPVKPKAKIEKPTKATKPAKAAKQPSVSPPKEEKKPKKTEAAPAVQLESLLMIPGAKVVKSPFFFDIEEEASNRKYVVQQKLQEKPTACSRPKINGNLDSKNLVEFLSQQLEYENKTYFEGCEGQICVKCNTNNVDAKFYVDKSLGYCTECATLLGLGQSKEGVFSDAQMELMRHSMEKLENVKDIDDESDIESALGDMDTLEFEETMLSEEDADFNA